jgi:hypothetical protein
MIQLCHLNSLLKFGMNNQHVLILGAHERRASQKHELHYILKYQHLLLHHYCFNSLNTIEEYEVHDANHEWLKCLSRLSDINSVAALTRAIRG